MDEATQQQPEDLILEKGQVIVAEFEVRDEMTLGQAREQIRSNTPTSFQLSGAATRESYTGSHNSENAL